MIRHQTQEEFNAQFVEALNYPEVVDALHEALDGQGIDWPAVDDIFAKMDGIFGTWNDRLKGKGAEK